MRLLDGLAVVIALGLGCYGLGRGFARRVGLEAAAPPMSAALGLALLISCGGLLNLARVAYAPVLWGLCAVGVALAAVHRRDPRLRTSFADRAAWLAGLLVASGLGLTLWLLVPPLSFNWHDDFQKYFVHPVRMLQTGSVYGSSLSAIGLETLGGQAFLHGFAVSAGDVDAINLVDQGFGLALCLALAAVRPATGPLAVVGAALALLPLVLIDPQVVNVSATYTAAALCLASWLLAFGASSSDRPLSDLNARGWALGLLLAALCALKTSFVVLSGAIALTWLLVLLWQTRSAPEVLRFALRCMAAWALFLAPWLVLHAPHYLSIGSAPPPHAPPAGGPAYEQLDLWSMEMGSYGARFGQHTATVVTIAALGAFAFVAARRATATQRWHGKFAILGGAALAATYLMMMYVAAPLGHGAETSLRLFQPILLGTLPALIALAFGAVVPAQRRAVLALSLLTCAPLVAFAADFPARFQKGLEQRSLQAFRELALDAEYIRYNQDLLFSPQGLRVRAAQAAVPAGEAVVAWVNAPFRLDYVRNSVTDLELAGLVTPWARIPETRYVIWEYNGPATPQPDHYLKDQYAPSRLRARLAVAGHRLTLVMMQLLRRSQVLFDDGWIMTLKLPSERALSSAYHSRR